MDKDTLIPLVKGGYMPNKNGYIPLVRGNGLTTNGENTEQKEETDNKKSEEKTTYEK